MKTKTILIIIFVLLAILFIPFETIQVDALLFLQNASNDLTLSKYLCIDSSSNPYVCRVTDSTTDTFNITYAVGKTTNAKLNIKKLFALLKSYAQQPSTFPLKTNVTKTMFYV